MQGFLQCEIAEMKVKIGCCNHPQQLLPKDGVRLENVEIKMVGPAGLEPTTKRL